MIPSHQDGTGHSLKVYQRGLVIDSQLNAAMDANPISVSKGIGD